jgi:hypothetical protein
MLTCISMTSSFYDEVPFFLCLQLDVLRELFLCVFHANLLASVVKGLFSLHLQSNVILSLLDTNVLFWNKTFQENRY